MNQDTHRLIQFLKYAKEEMVCVFDVGTRATRLLLAPATVPASQWTSELFFNARDISRLGSDVGRFDGNLEVQDSGALERAVRFIKGNTHVLLENGVKVHNIHAVGTAVFRWLENTSEVIEHIREETGVTIRILSEKEEAQISLAGIAFTHSKRPGGPDIGSRDCIVLIDQGGGSTEVSYSTADGSEANLHSFDDFGTVALRRKFFTMGAGGRVEPSENRRRIVTQLDRIWEFAEETIEKWEGYPSLGDRTVHVYGMGSAITNCFPGVSNFKIHNRVCSISQIRETIRLHANALDYEKEQILTLWKRYKSEEYMIEKDSWDNLENRLLAVYGLPVFAKLLKKLRVSELRICGYGLRYAYYVWKYHYRASV
jgi:exopolyphosphatase/pppGpp-phosphohydrolase